MNKSLLSGLVACLLLLAVPVAFAGVRMPVVDSTGYASIAVDGTELRAVSGGVGTCAVSGTSYLRFALNDVPKSIGRATLTLKLTRVPLAGTSTVSVLAVSDDAWTATSPRADTPPTGSSLAELSYATQPQVGGTVVFTSSATGDARLIDFLHQQLASDPAGEKFASLAIRVTACSPGSFEYRFASADRPAIGDRPALDLFLEDGSPDSHVYLPLIVR